MGCGASKGPLQAGSTKALPPATPPEKTRADKVKQLAQGKSSPGVPGTEKNNRKNPSTSNAKQPGKKIPKGSDSELAKHQQGRGEDDAAAEQADWSKLASDLFAADVDDDLVNQQTSIEFEKFNAARPALSPERKPWARQAEKQEQLVMRALDLDVGDLGPATPHRMDTARLIEQELVDTLLDEERGAEDMVDAYLDSAGPESLLELSTADSDSSSIGCVRLNSMDGSQLDTRTKKLLAALFPHCSRLLFWTVVSTDLAAGRLGAIQVWGIDATGRGEDPVLVLLGPAELIHRQQMAAPRLFEFFSWYAPSLVRGPVYCGKRPKLRRSLLAPFEAADQSQPATMDEDEEHDVLLDSGEAITYFYEEDAETPVESLEARKAISEKDAAEKLPPPAAQRPPPGTPGSPMATIKWDCARLGTPTQRHGDDVDPESAFKRANQDVAAELQLREPRVLGGVCLQLVGARWYAPEADALCPEHLAPPMGTFAQIVTQGCSDIAGQGVVADAGARAAWSIAMKQLKKGSNASSSPAKTAAPAKKDPKVQEAAVRRAVECILCELFRSGGELYRITIGQCKRAKMSIFQVYNFTGLLERQVFCKEADLPLGSYFRGRTSRWKNSKQLLVAMAGVIRKKGELLCKAWKPLMGYTHGVCLSQFGSCPPFTADASACRLHGFLLSGACFELRERAHFAEACAAPPVCRGGEACAAPPRRRFAAEVRRVRRRRFAAEVRRVRRRRFAAEVRRVQRRRCAAEVGRVQRRRCAAEVGRVQRRRFAAERRFATEVACAARRFAAEVACAAPPVCAVRRVQRRRAAERRRCAAEVGRVQRRRCAAEVGRVQRRRFAAEVRACEAPPVCRGGDLHGNNIIYTEAGSAKWILSTEPVLWHHILRDLAILESAVLYECTLLPLSLDEIGRCGEASRVAAWLQVPVDVAHTVMRWCEREQISLKQESQAARRDAEIRREHAWRTFLRGAEIPAEWRGVLGRLINPNTTKAGQRLALASKMTALLLDRPDLCTAPARDAEDVAAYPKALRFSYNTVCQIRECVATFLRAAPAEGLDAHMLSYWCPLLEQALAAISNIALSPMQQNWALLSTLKIAANICDLLEQDMSTLTSDIPERLKQHLSRTHTADVAPAEEGVVKVHLQAGQRLDVLHEGQVALPLTIARRSSTCAPSAAQPLLNERQAPQAGSASASALWKEARVARFNHQTEQHEFSPAEPNSTPTSRGSTPPSRVGTPPTDARGRRMQMMRGPTVKTLSTALMKSMPMPPMTAPGKMWQRLAPKSPAPEQDPASALATPGAAESPFPPPAAGSRMDLATGIYTPPSSNAGSRAPSRLSHVSRDTTVPIAEPAASAAMSWAGSETESRPATRAGAVQVFKVTLEDGWAPEQPPEASIQNVTLPPLRLDTRPWRPLDRFLGYHLPRLPFKASSLERAVRPESSSPQQNRVPVEGLVAVHNLVHTFVHGESDASQAGTYSGVFVAVHCDIGLTMSREQFRVVGAGGDDKGGPNSHPWTVSLAGHVIGQARMGMMETKHGGRMEVDVAFSAMPGAVMTPPGMTSEGQMTTTDMARTLLGKATGSSEPKEGGVKKQPKDVLMDRKVDRWVLMPIRENMQVWAAWAAGKREVCVEFAGVESGKSRQTAGAHLTRRIVQAYGPVFLYRRGQRVRTRVKGFEALPWQQLGWQEGTVMSFDKRSGKHMRLMVCTACWSRRGGPLRARAMQTTTGRRRDLGAPCAARDLPGPGHAHPVSPPPRPGAASCSLRACWRAAALWRPGPPACASRFQFRSKAQKARDFIFGRGCPGSASQHPNGSVCTWGFTPGAGGVRATFHNGTSREQTLDPGPFRSVCITGFLQGVHLQSVVIHDVPLPSVRGLLTTGKANSLTARTVLPVEALLEQAPGDGRGGDRSGKKERKDRTFMLDLNTFNHCCFSLDKVTFEVPPLSHSPALFPGFQGCQRGEQGG
ncbi:hypothetical protein CYMTET_33269 [Cymbomonas tetramitiformis]|uniref:Uncharacterized protein n=1 Tax=Cymbomonas tetramitiformis TaxID=36881 RepID=A0AAE0KR46_9CHLO|nr:hypothetical protein CYMTET_33269 [Cymbomonas tetramitiformis]